MIEVNMTTGDKRQHTRQSMQLRLRALGIKDVAAAMVAAAEPAGLAVGTSWFRPPKFYDPPQIRPAQANGAWGFD